MTRLFRTTWFEMLRSLRNRQFFFFSLIMPATFYLIFVNVNGANTQLPGTGTTWKAYYLMSMATYSVVGSSLFGLSARVSYERSEGWLRLLQTTPLPNSIYLISKVLGQFLIAALSIVILFAVGHWVENVQLSAVDWTLSGIWIVLGSMPFIALGMLLGVMISVEATYIVANILSLGLSIAGGLWWPLQTMPQIMQQIGHWLPTYRYADVSWRLLGNLQTRATDLLLVAGYAVLFVMFTLWLMRRQEERAI